ncbi:right-handed parallel beta-helix repeat-containing protein [Roseibacterium beibuensis]|uniref:right-handed parallel beta-helix repeat-containing protein n=1 Tax=[Roseibacterium] beibuensis TaxID=1193142 RepID=UPI00217CC29F|nr:right-handed parallel beta-helix repeat-containing protein [Roseibacterium beibuensis]MCS6623214.1 right-handed parallel beta-helix repeat-containing protein [Roseibacterium beibuensis]
MKTTVSSSTPRDALGAGVGAVLNRRTVLFGLMASAAALPGPVRAQPTDDAVHVSLRASGDADGRDWNNALPLSRLNRLAASARPGQSIFVGLPEGETPHPWSGQHLRWAVSGTPTEAVSLHFGVLREGETFHQPDHAGEAPVFQMIGNETEPGERPDVGGAPFIVFQENSSNLHISGPSYLRSGGNGFFNLDTGGEIQNLSFADIHAVNVGRVIETEQGTSVRDLLVERCSALGMIRGFARFHDLFEAEFRDLDLDADFVDGGGGAVCQIISVKSGADLSFRNLRLEKAINSLAAEERGSRYIQGDGLVLEEETRNVRIEDCYAADMGDGGFDLKSEHVYMANCRTERCKLGIRIWSHHPGNLIENCVMSEPVTRPHNDGSCLWLAGNLTARNCSLISAGDMSPIRFGGGADGTPDSHLRIEGGEISYDERESLVTGTAGTLELENVLVNGVETSGRFHWTGRRLRRRW